MYKNYGVNFGHQLKLPPIISFTLKNGLFGHYDNVHIGLYFTIVKNKKIKKNPTNMI